MDFNSAAPPLVSRLKALECYNTPLGIYIKDSLIKYIPKPGPFTSVIMITIFSKIYLKYSKVDPTSSINIRRDCLELLTDAYCKRDNFRNENPDFISITESVSSRVSLRRGERRSIPSDTSLVRRRKKSSLYGNIKSISMRRIDRHKLFDKFSLIDL